ncbi:MAG: MBOAT family protein [Eubacterium sp.]|nr:MBOAT family protein [Eubacterium sp.]
MELISLKYCIFVLALVICYYIVPKKHRWSVLLVGSMAYYVIVCKWYVGFILFTIVSTYLIAVQIQKMLGAQNAVVKEHKAEWDRQTRREYKERGRKKRVALLTLGLVLNFGILGFLKYVPFAEGWGLLLPLGISFYTFQSMGYLFDVYREIVEPQRNILKFALFVSFFPQIIQGPIAIYDKVAHQLYEGHSFSFTRTKRALCLILWGVMKKLIIADRAATIIKLVTADSTQYSGTIVLITALTYAVQLYADFSGGIDIVRGVGELFGITLPINFNCPYFSRSLTEYWHRWHMTLGDWCRNYIFYPLSISKKFMNFAKWLRPRFGDHISKVLPGCIASVITFLVIGIWHGANMKYVYFGLWNGIVIMISELIAPARGNLANAIFTKTRLKAQGAVATIVSVVWTWVMILVGYYFDIAKNAKDAMSMLVRSVTDFHITDCAPKAFIETLQSTGLDGKDYMLLLISVGFWFCVSMYQERTGREIRKVILIQKTSRRWAILLLGIFAVLLFGYYGPAVQPADFVYMQF